MKENKAKIKNGTKNYFGWKVHDVSTTTFLIAPIIVCFASQKSKMLNT